MAVLTQARAFRAVAQSKLDFSAVQDKRAHRSNKQQKIGGILNLLVAAFTCGKMKLRSIEDFSADISEKNRRHLGLTTRVSDTTQFEMLKRTPPKGFLQTLQQQIRRGIKSKAITNDLFAGGVVSYDGKGAGSGLGEAPHKLCKSSVCDKNGTLFWHVFALRASLTSSSARPCVNQEIIRSKKGEATTFPLMFKRDVKKFPRLFRYVTGDAGLASKSNAEIVLKHNKHYIWQIKGNFSRLYPMASELLAKTPVESETSEVYQGAIVTRQLRRIAMPADVQFPGATQFVGVRSIRTDKSGVIESEDRVFITSIPINELSPARLLKLVRLHWGIENNCNWTADMIFDEDSSRPCNLENGPVVIPWLIILAYNIVAVFRAHLPRKDNLPERWERARELIYQAFLVLASEKAQAVSRD